MNLAIPPNDSPELLKIVGKFRTDIEDHTREEEETLFPRLKAGLSAENNKPLTLSMKKEEF